MDGEKIKVISIKVIRFHEITLEVGGSRIVKVVPFQKSAVAGESGHPRKWSDEEELEMANDYKAGMTMEAIGEKYGGSKAGIFAVLKKFDIGKRKTGRKKQEEIVGGKSRLDKLLEETA